jgi:carboxypeptidase Q
MTLCRRTTQSLVASLAMLVLPTARAAQAQQPEIAAYRAAADSLIRAATADSSAYRRLGLMVDTFGHRLSGSASLEAAIDWILDSMKADGLENVRGQRVMVPRWVRGDESAELVKPRRAKLAMLGLGMSVGTPKGGITAPVLVVGSLDELKERASEAKGKIVLLDVPFTDYVATRKVRTDGPSAAARVGAVGCLIRSVASNSIRSPHTGMTRYDSTAAKIPAAALSVEDAAMLHRFQDRGQPIVLTLRMSARTLPDAPSRNVVAEIVGREKPDEVVVVGGHIDSWDVGQGAMDDGGGAVGAWEAVRLMQRLNLRPRRTVRVVLWTNEENGGRGGLAYRDRHRAELAGHVAMIESDNGVFRPAGFGFTGSDTARQTVTAIASLLSDLPASSIVAGGDGADITPSVQEAHIPGLSLEVDSSTYFTIHHTQADTVDKIDPVEMAKCAAAMTVMAYVLADIPERLAR